MNQLCPSSSSVTPSILLILVPPLCQGSMLDDIRARVAGSYTTSPTVHCRWYHPHSIQPSYLRPSSLQPHLIVLPFPPPFFLRSGLLISSYSSPSSVSSLGLSMRFLTTCSASLNISFLILSNLITPHMHRCIRISATANLFSSAFFKLYASFIQWLSFQCHVGLQLQLGLCSSRSLLSPTNSKHYLPVLPTVLHSVGDFCNQLFVIRQRRSQIFEYMTLCSLSNRYAQEKNVAASNWSCNIPHVLHEAHAVESLRRHTDPPTITV